RSRADHVYAEQFVVLLLGHDLHEPVGFTGDLGSSENRKRKRSDTHIVTARARLLLGEADAADLGIAVGAPRDVIVVERARGLSGNALRGDNAFRGRDV